jgi:PilZ domain
MGWEPKELRKWGRYEVQIRAKITIPNSDDNAEWYGQTLDLSEGGLRFFIPHELEVGIVLSMEFALPYASRSLTINGVIRNQESFTYGIEFCTPTDEQRQIIARVCKTLELLQ